MPRSWLHSIVFILNLITDATSPERRRFCNVDNSLSERRRNNVDYTTSIIRREGDVETTSIFSRSTSRLHFDEISTSKRRRVPAGQPSLPLHDDVDSDVIERNDGSSFSSEDDNVNDDSLREGLVNWTNKFLIKQNALDSLLVLLKSNGHPDLPGCARSLLHTSRSIS